MKKRPLGRTGLEVSEVVLGGGRVGGILIFPGEPIRAAALDRLVQAGVNWVDTAPSYGNGESESTLGRHLRRLDHALQVSTKVTIRPEDLSDIAGAVERSLEQSLERLRRDHVELLQLHNHLGGSEARHLAIEHVLKKGGVADALEGLKARGLIKACGMTAAGETRACLEAIASGRFDTAQVYYNMLNPSAAWQRAPAKWSPQDFSGIVDACRRQGMGMLNIRVYAGGSLASAQRHGREFVMAAGSDLDSEARRAGVVRAALADAYGTPAQAALRFCLGQPELSCCVVGIAELPYLEEAIRAAGLGPLPREAVATLEALWARDFLSRAGT